VPPGSHTEAHKGVEAVSEGIAYVGEQLQRLRYGKCLSRLRKYEEDIIARYAYNSSYRLWKETGYSSTEYTAFKLVERLKP